MTFGIPSSVRGADDLERLAKALKAAGAKEIRKDMLRGFRNAGKPVTESIKDNLRDELPHGGGLNEWAASAKLSVRTRTSGKNVGIRIVGTKAGHDFKAINSGQIRHPVHGGPAWVLQNIPPGIWDRGGAKALPKVLKALREVMNDTAVRIDRSV